ncbi:MAG: TonB-dependent receptor [Acidobacteria bacterium]|nr:TonB-dependent receptor [Acidobacteriota bacterium]
MKSKAIVLALVALFATSALASAQSQVGEIFGKVTDQSGGVLPGVTVTLSAPNLLQPLTAVTSGTGTYQFPRLEIGTYTVKFELTGFKTQISQDVFVTVGFSAQINAQLGVSTVQETITVTGASPIVDTKDTGTKQTFTNELLQSIPSARDPWVILQQTAGVAMDRENIGGNMSGQQSNYISRGGNPFNNKWSLDGVDITDMSATGASPSYYDFDAFEEMTINTGGVDVTQQTGGVGINLVTKAGSDKFRGSGRSYATDQKFESQNLTDAQRTQGASSGNPIQNIKDYGFEAGGPLKKGKAWVWGSFGKQNIGVGVLNFYQPDANCQTIKADEARNPLAHPVTEVNDCLNTDLTVLTTTNLKAEVQLFKGNKLSLFNNFAKKERNARGADDLHPIETTTPQGAVPDTYGLGKNLWTIGPNPTYKAGDQWVLSDRTLLDVQWAHIGNNFILDFHDPSLAAVQPTLIIATGLNGRSGSQNIFIRPVQSVDVNVNHFMPGAMGGDHALKIGGHWRDAFSFSQAHTGGNAIARFQGNDTTTNCAALALANPAAPTRWCQAQLTRDSQTQYDLLNWSAYVQDTITHNRLTMQLGVRYDYYHDQALSSSVPGNPLFADWLPGISFAGADPKVTFNNFSPRVGFTYDLQGNGKTIARANFARYYGQVGTGGVSSQINPVTAANVRFPWTDANGDKVIQPNEVLTGRANILSFGGNYDPANPSFLGTQNTVDPNLKNDTTDEFIVGFDREIGAGFAAGVNYIWRRYAGFQFSDTVGLEPADYAAVSFTPPAAACPSGATCPAITYYQPNFLIPGVSTLTNFSADQFNRVYNGVEATARKRMSHHWLMNTSFAYNSTIVNNGFAGAFANGLVVGGFAEDPTNRAQRNGGQYDYQTSGSGIGNVYVNAKWLFKLSGLYQLPGDVNVSAFYNARQGYPFERFIQTPSRPNGGGGIASVLIDTPGDSRLPNYQNLDFHVERPVKLGSIRFIPSMDVFNVFNSNTEQAIRGTQNASNANNIQAILAPRVARFGVRVNW